MAGTASSSTRAFEPAASCGDEMFTITASNKDDEAVVVLVGELDISTAPRLAEALQCLPRSGQRRTVVDVSALSFCDSSGLAVLVHARQRHEALGIRLILTGATSALKRLLGITGLGAYLGTDGDMSAGAPTP